MTLFSKRKKQKFIEENYEEYKKYLQLMNDINVGIVSADLLNTDPTKKGLTTEDLDLIIKFGNL